MWSGHIRINKDQCGPVIWQTNGNVGSSQQPSTGSTVLWVDLARTYGIMQGEKRAKETEMRPRMLFLILRLQGISLKKKHQEESRSGRVPGSAALVQPMFSLSGGLAA